MSTALRSSLVFHVVFEGGLLENNHREISVRSDHDLIHLRADLDEEDVLIRVQMLNDLVSLIFELCHSFHPAHSRNTIEYPTKLSVFRDCGLVKKNGFFRVKP